MSEICQMPDCGRPLLEGQAPPPSAQLCKEHDEEMLQAVRDGDIRKLVSMGAKVANPFRGGDPDA